mgnify:CR=1 FL=1
MTAPDFTAVLCRDRHALRQLHRQIRERERRGQPTDRLRARFAAEYAASTAAVEARRAALPQPKLSADLPVLAAKNDILRLIREHQVVIISGETGSGKTTQLPQLCLALGLGGLTVRLGGCCPGVGVGCRSSGLRLAGAALSLGGLAPQLLGLGAVIGNGRYIGVFAVIGLAMNFYAYWNSGKLAIRAMQAYPVSETQAPAMYRIVRELSTKAGQKIGTPSS